MQLTQVSSVRTRPMWLFIVGGLAVVAGAGWWLTTRTTGTPPTPAAGEPHGAEPGVSAEGEPGVVEYPREMWKAAGLEVQALVAGTLEDSLELTGKIALNDDGVAHIFPLVEGRVDEVKVQFGQRVKQGDLLVVVQSKEVGQAMLQLFQDRLLLEFAKTKDTWTQVASTNAKSMIQLIRDGAKIEEIERQLINRPMGDYRDRLMTAYIGHYKSQIHLERLAPLSEDGVVTGRQLLEAQADTNATRAGLQALLEQIEQDAHQASVLSTQTVKELQTRISVDETTLKILGFKPDAIESIDPEAQGEAIAHYPVYAPLDGTIISKDVVLLERVGPERQILSIADLSQVWVTTDVYEEHLAKLGNLEQRTIFLRSNAWPGKRFEARIFYTGDVVNEVSRTVSMRAVADNAEGLLKPGMFVNVEFPNVKREDVVQAPESAIQEHEGQAFVFVEVGEGRFARRDVTLGQRTSGAVEIAAGAQPGEVVVTRGGFALKSKMLAELLGGE